jgi:hypothetical protein
MASGGSSAQGGTKAFGGTMISGGTSASGTGGISGSGGRNDVCSGRPSTCVALCQGGTACVCYCPESGGAGGSSTATGGSGGIGGTGGGSASSSGISCFDSSGAIATAAKACTLASDCKQAVAPACCGAIMEVGLAKSSSCRFPALTCGNLGCASFTYQRGEDGKYTDQGGTIGLECVSGQCKTFVMPGGADAAADGGPSALDTAGDAGSQSCGSTTCHSGQACVLVSPGPVPRCQAPVDGGCPFGLVYAAFCGGGYLPALSPGCTDPAPAPFCRDLPDGCDGLCDCACPLNPPSGCTVTPAYVLCAYP